MSYIEESLSTGEKVEALFKLHWFGWVPMVCWLLLGLIFGFIWFITVYEFLKILGLIMFSLTLFIAIYEFLKLRYLEQGVTNKRVILKKGIISRQTEEMKISSIETVEINQGIFGRIFGFGTVKITGHGISDFLFKGIDDPITVKRQIESISNPVQ